MLTRRESSLSVWVPSLTFLVVDLDAICTIAVQILEQKATCQQDPGQDDDEETPEDQAEYDSILVSSAGDLVAALAAALGPDFSQGFNTFFPLISKYYVSVFDMIMNYMNLNPSKSQNPAPGLTVQPPSAASLRS
jgi:hypothetical protein